MNGRDIPPVLTGVFGDPIAHSLSPAMQTAAFRRRRLHYVYLKFRVPAPDLQAALRGAALLGFRGVNLTIPLKEAALRLVDVLTPVARNTGAVNTVTFGGPGRIEGHSTDGAGFLRAFHEAWKTGVRGEKVLLLGAGGAARSVAFALASAGVRAISLCDLDGKRLARLLRDLRDRAKFRARGAQCPLPRIDDRMLDGVTLVVNATPLGMDGRSVPLMPGLLAPAMRVVDLVYNPAVTPLIRMARRRGLRCINGEGMLVHQGALSFERWTGRRAPVAAMRHALAAALRRRRRGK